jgi:hypothetical protein
MSKKLGQQRVGTVSRQNGIGSAFDDLADCLQEKLARWKFFAMQYSHKPRNDSCVYKFLIYFICSSDEVTQRPASV